jgi:hypothetical protein
MRRVLLVIMVIMAASGTYMFGQKKKDIVKEDTMHIKKDTTEYELIIFDTGFDAWLAMQPSKNHYSNEYYRRRNNLYVQEWNNRYLNPHRYGGIYGNYIDFDPMTDYGIDVNYRLYYYFRYFEEMNGVKLLPGKR